MEYDQLLQTARSRMSGCRACPVCDGRACGGSIPGPGAKAGGDVAIRNHAAWQALRLRMDALHDVRTPDTRLTVFGRSFALPVFAAPVGAVDKHYGPAFNDASYNDVLVAACAQQGIAAFTGDGVDPAVMRAACAAVRRAGGVGVPTIKPWADELVEEKLALARESGAFAVAMDVDAAGLPFLKGCEPPAGCKSPAQLARLIRSAGVPFIVKGVMTARGAEKAVEAGAAAVVVSNHGGRVLAGCAATAEALPEVAAAVQGAVPLLVDGGIRTGTDIFRALALGASGVLIGRPFVTAVYGGGAEGVRCYVEKLAGELADAMLLCGAATLADISAQMIARPWAAQGGWQL